jgi:hypothetical protein
MQEGQGKEVRSRLLHEARDLLRGQVLPEERAVLPRRLRHGVLQEQRGLLRRNLLRSRTGLLWWFGVLRSEEG